jgi:hypothetical protein
MLFVNTAEVLANPVGELVSTEYPLGLDHLALAVGTHFGSMALRATGSSWATSRVLYAHSVATVFDSAVVSGDPFLDELALLCQEALSQRQEAQSLLAKSFEPLAAPRKKLRGYGAHRTAVHEPQPAPAQLGQIESP